MMKDEHVAISDMCKNFSTNELAPTAAYNDKTHTFPATHIKKMGELGLMGMTVSEEYGGAQNK